MNPRVRRVRRSRDKEQSVARVPMPAGDNLRLIAAECSRKAARDFPVEFSHHPMAFR